MGVKGRGGEGMKGEGTNLPSPNPGSAAVNNNFSVKNAIILCSFMFIAKENRKSSPIIKFTVLPF